MSKEYNKYPKGSEWRRWDLHIHTPFTKLNDQYTAGNNDDEKWNLFCQKIEESNVSVFGITDYFSVGNYNTFIKKYKNKYPRSKKVFFPNIEFRIDSKNSKSEHIQFHVILSNKKEIITKISDFLTRLPLVSTDDTSLKNKYCIINDLNSVGFDKAMVTIENLNKILNNNFSKNEFIMIGVANGYGSLRPNTNDGRGAEYAKELDKKSDFFFGDENNVEFYLNKECGRNKFKLSPKAVLVGSDCHSFVDMDGKSDKKFTWIKADPTFEGLKQIIYEPEDRVKIQANKPEEKSGYQVIKSIEIDNEICKQNIPLNPSLNTIVGGRSTGKSTLLQLIAYNLNSQIDVNTFIKNISNIVKVTWQDDEEDKSRDIEFFPQNHMHDIAKDNQEKNKTIKQIVVEKDKNEFIKNYGYTCRNNKITIQNNIDNLFSLQDDINDSTKNLKERGDKAGVEKEIENIKNNIENIKKNDNFSEENFEEFEKIQKNILEKEHFVKQSTEDKTQIEYLITQELFDQSIDYKFNNLSVKNCNDIRNIFMSIQREAKKSWEEKLRNKLNEITLKITVSNQDIKNHKNKDIFKKGFAYIENNKQYKELEERLKKETNKLKEIIDIQNKIIVLSGQKNELSAKTIDNHLVYFNETNQVIENFSLEHEDIKIKIEKEFMKEKCRSLLEDFVNLQGKVKKDFVKQWIETYEENIEEKIKYFLEKALGNTIELKAYKDIKDLTKGLLTENWFSISYQLTYQNDVFEKMSDGKKAFVILKLLLEFSDKKCPILIDQPEDSLDNRAIYNDLVTYIKQKKKERQIILVTHNANIVLNADAEEVIVANQHGEDSKNKDDIQFQYVSGGLENTKLKNSNEIVLESQGIREHVCEILEGGTEAFKKRESKYGLQ